MVKSVAIPEDLKLFLSNHTTLLDTSAQTPTYAMAHTYPDTHIHMKNKIQN